MFQPRVVTLEQEALNVPELRQAHEQRALQAQYWRACSSALAGSQIALRENDPVKGQTVCRFNTLDDGIRFRIQYYPSDTSLCVYLGVSSSAARNQRRLFRELIESHIPELEALIGQQLHLKDPYFWVAISGDIKAQQDWPRQHQWIKEIAGKFLSVFKPRIGIE